MNTKETALERDLRRNPWAEGNSGKYAQVEFWSDFWRDGSDKLAKRMLATPIYDQTIAQKESAPLERVYTKEELDRRLAVLREGFENKRAKARERFDGYQEELLEIIRRRNSEKEELLAQIERLGKQVYGLGGEPVV